jgi:cholestenol delta-isomerase
MEAVVAHPYYPTTLSIPNYVPNERSTLEIYKFSGGIMFLLISASFILSRLSKTTTSVSRFTWFFVCGIMHCGFEGYWLLNKDIIPGHNSAFAELWKEYAHGDSRYLAADELLWTLEVITAVNIIKGLLYTTSY